MTIQLAPDAQTYDCRKAFADDADRARPRRRADRRRVQRLRRLVQPRRLQRGVPGPADQRRHRRAGPRRRRRRPGERRHDPVRQRRGPVPHRPRARADQGRRRLLPTRTCILCGQSPGMAYGELGPTHHSIEDLVLDARDRRTCNGARARPTRSQTRAGVRWAVEQPGPAATCASPRFKVPEVTPDGRGVRARASPCSAAPTATTSRVIAVGTMVSRAVDAAERLRADGISRARDQHAVRRPARRRRRCWKPRARPRGDRHRGGGASSPAASAPPSRASSRSTGPSRCGSSASTTFAPDRQREVPARPLRPDRRRHRRSSARARWAVPLTIILAIDQGTSATKAVLVDADRRDRRPRLARRVGSARRRPGWVEQDAERDLGLGPDRGRGLPRRRSIRAASRRSA